MRPAFPVCGGSNTANRHGELTAELLEVTRVPEILAARPMKSPQGPSALREQMRRTQWRTGAKRGPMTQSSELTVGEMLLKAGISRRGFIQYCTAVASAMALPPWMGPAMAEQLRNSPRPSVDLPVVPGMHRMSGVLDPVLCAHHREPDLQHHLAGLQRHARWPRPARPPNRPAPRP